MPWRARVRYKESRMYGRKKIERALVALEMGYNLGEAAKLA